MQVIFSTKSKNQNRYTISNVEGFGKIYFNKGALTTTDKDLIRTLLNHPLYSRGDYKLVTNEKLVADYLDGKMSDKVTEDILNSLTLKGIKEIGKALACKSEQPALIKAEALGRPITNQAQEVIDYYSMSEEETDAPKENKAPEEIEVKNSADMTAIDAADFILSSSVEDLEGFLADDEERKTVLKAWNTKFETVEEDS